MEKIDISKKQKEIRDTSGDTKVFKTIRKEDIERENKRKAIEMEKTGSTTVNTNKSNSSIKREDKGTVNNSKKNNSPKINSQKNNNQKNSIQIINNKMNSNQLNNNKKNNKQLNNNNNNQLNRSKITNNNDLQNKRAKMSNSAIKRENYKPYDNASKNTASKNTASKNNASKNNVPQNSPVQKRVIENSAVKSNVATKNISKNNVENVIITNKPEKTNKSQSMIINENNYKNEYKVKDNKTNKKHSILKVILIFIILILVVTIFSTIFSFINITNEKIINGVKVNNVDVSNLTKEEAIQTIDKVLNNNETNIITIKRKDYERKINLDDINGRFEVENAVNSAYNVGREKDIITNNYKTLGVLITGTEITSNFVYDNELLENIIKEISLELPDLAMDSSYIIEGDKLIIKNSTDGVKIQKEEFKQKLINAFSGMSKQFEIPVEKAEKQDIDIQKIHDEIYKEPVNAYCTKDPYKVYKEEYGLDFAISINDAIKMLEENKVEYEIPLKKLKPKVTVSDLGDTAFPSVLGTFTTTYGTADVNRNANIALAAKSINSVVVMPGEVFSYNDLIGECSTKTGYKTSTIYLNGKLSTGVGGGICQVSTTLYNAVLRANLEIVQRRNHSLGVTYVPAGQDAMVNIGTSDFKFKNNREYPIKVIAYVNTGSVTCTIKGVKQDVEYDVKLESKTIEKTDEKYKVQTFKVLYLNGNVVSRTWLSTDTYKYH